MNYFRRTKDISLSKLEILADYFHKPLAKNWDELLLRI